MLSIVVFVELFVVEVYHPKIVIGKLRAASRRLPGATVKPEGIARYVPKNSGFLGHK